VTAPGVHLEPWDILGLRRMAVAWPGARGVWVGRGAFLLEDGQGILRDRNGPVPGSNRIIASTPQRRAIATWRRTRQTLTGDDQP
jgi:hypothetical protein